MYLMIIKVYPQRFDREIWRVFGGIEAGSHKPLNPLIHLTKRAQHYIYVYSVEIIPDYHVINRNQQFSNMATWGQPYFKITPVPPWLMV